MWSFTSLCAEGFKKVGVPAGLIFSPRFLHLGQELPGILHYYGIFLLGYGLLIHQLSPRGDGCGAGFDELSSILQIYSTRRD